MAQVDSPDDHGDGAARVFAVPELLEISSPTSLSMTSSPSSAHARLSATPLRAPVTLQRAMFHAPSPTPKEIEFNPLLDFEAQAGPALFATRRSNSGDEPLEGFTRCKTKYIQSPDLRFDILLDRHMPDFYDHLQLAHNIDKRKAANESWRKTSVTSAPVRVVSAGLRANKNCEKNGHHYRNDVKYWKGFQGFTMGVSVEWLEGEYECLAKRRCCPLRRD